MASPETIQFDIWGCRGSHSIIPARSRVGNDTSCYSLLDRGDLFVLDAGRGLLMLGYSMGKDPGFGRVRRIHLFVTHAHLDHWEGLKDVDWFWKRNNGLEVTIYGTPQALRSIKHGFAHPSYVPLPVLTRGTVATLRFRSMRRGQRRRIGRLTIEAFPLNHYSGSGKAKRRLDTVGFRLTAAGGPRIAYLSDHEPTRRTRSTEDRMLEGAHLAIYDAHFADIRDQTYGHGSQEAAADVARRHPATAVLAAHHGPMFSDAQLRAARRRHGRGVPNFDLAVEGARYRWNRGKGRLDLVHVKPVERT